MTDQNSDSTPKRGEPAVWRVLQHAAVVVLALGLLWLAKRIVFGPGRVELTREGLYQLEVLVLATLLLVLGWPKIVAMVTLINRGPQERESAHETIGFRSVFVVLTALGGSLLVIIGAVALLESLKTRT